VTSEQAQVLSRNAGASRFAFNQGLAMLNAAYEAHKANPGVKVPYSKFDLINAFNAWKRSPAAANAGAESPGLAWRDEVIAQVFEEGLTDLSCAVKRFFDGRKQGGKGQGFPRFKKRSRGKVSFRLRNRANDVRVNLHSIRLPKLGELPVCESTRRLRRLLRTPPGAAAQSKILFATVVRRADHWYVRLNIATQPLHPSQRHAQVTPAAGIDRGLSTFAVVANAEGRELLRSHAPKPLKSRLRALRRLSRRLSRTQKGSKNRERQRRRLARLHARIACIRLDHVHKLSSFVAKTHSHIALEDLHIAGMLRNRSLARSISDVSWGAFATQVRYKAAWRDGLVTSVDRFFPSSKTCHQCAFVVAALPLSKRVFACPSCSLQCDRDYNAAINCARFADEALNRGRQAMDTLNVCGDGGAGRDSIVAVKPPSVKQKKPWAAIRAHGGTFEKNAVYLIVNRP